jgi:hypothetical protein
MEPIKKPVQPFYLPQITCPYRFISEQLTAFGVAHEPVKVAVSQLKPMQKEVDMSKIMSLSEVAEEKLRPIFVSEKYDILDGHHRVASKKYKEGKNAIVRAIRIEGTKEDGCAYLKIIQDRWERSQENQAA